MLTMIILALSLFKFPVTLNSFKRFRSCTNFIFATILYRSSSCCSSTTADTCYCSPSSLAAASWSSSSASFSTMSFNLSYCPYPIFSIILLYSKEVVSLTLCSLSASTSRVATTGADTALYNFEIVFLKNVPIS